MSSGAGQYTRIYAVVRRIPRGRVATYEGIGDRSQAPARPAAGGAAEEELVRELTALGYMSGCVAGPPRLFCPDDVITWNAAAIPLDKAFNDVAGLSGPGGAYIA